MTKCCRNIGTADSVTAAAFLSFISGIGGIRFLLWEEDTNRSSFDERHVSEDNSLRAIMKTDWRMVF